VTGAILEIYRLSHVLLLDRQIRLLVVFFGVEQQTRPVLKCPADQLGVGRLVLDEQNR